MAKKVKQKDEVKAELVEWPEGDVQIGTPTMVLLPARNYMFKVVDQEHKITIPRSGSYHDIDPEFFSEEEGEFSLFDSKSKVMFLPSMSKILFATKKYPNLEPNQLFAPLALVFKKDKVDIIGQLIEMLEPDSVEEESRKTKTKKKGS